MQKCNQIVIFREQFVHLNKR